MAGVSPEVIGRLRLAANIIASIEAGVLHVYVRVDDLKALLDYAELLLPPTAKPAPVFDLDLQAFVAENMWVLPQQIPQPEHGYALTTATGKPVNVERSKSWHLLRDVAKHHNDLLEVIAQHLQNPPYVVGAVNLVKKAPGPEMVEQAINKLADIVTTAFADVRLARATTPTPPIVRLLRAFAYEVRGISEDLQFRYHNDPVFHQFVDQKIAQAMLEDGETTADQQASALREIEGMGFATPNDTAYKMVEIARRGLGKKKAFEVPWPAIRSVEFNQLLQIAKGPVTDGDLISKDARDTLVKRGKVRRIHGWNYLSDAGVTTCVQLEILAD